MMDGYSMTGWGWLWMSLTMGASLALIVALFVVLTRRPDQPAAREPSTPEGILRARFARGEIDETEFRRRLRLLSGDGTLNDGAAS